MDFLLRPLRFVNSLVEAAVTVLSSCIAAVMVLALAMSAVTRYVSGTGYDWFIELPPALVPWLVFPLLGPLLRSGGHIQVDLVPTFLKGRAALILKIFVYLVMLAGSVIFFIAGNEAVALFRRLEQLMELEIEVPIWWMYLAFPTGFAILFLFSLELLIESIAALLGKKESSA